MRNLNAYLLLSLFFLLASCSGDDDDDNDDKMEEEETCFTGFSEAEISDNTQIVEDYNQSIHELIACGNITIALCQATVSFISEVATGAATGTTPQGIEFGESGVYKFTSGNNVSMSIVFVNGVTSSLGEAGTPIVHNMFDANNYLIGVNASLSATELKLSFNETGPLVELMGFGANPESPIIIPLTLAGLSEIEVKIDDLLVTSEISVDDPQNNSVITYEVELSEGTTFESILNGDFNYEVVDAAAERSDLEQNLVNTTWNLNFSNEGSNSGALTGDVAFEVFGGLFDFQGTLTWMDSGFGTSLIECQE
jgi:hypothetical protein